MISSVLKVITGILQVRGATDGTLIGNVADALKVTGTVKNQDSAGQNQYNFPAGFVRVSDEPTEIFYDPFDTALDTVNYWNTPVSAGGGVAASAINGAVILGTGTTASGYSHLSSQPTFRPTVPAWLGVSFAIKIESPVTANTYRFWGAGTVPATPTAAAPVTDGYGFELDTTGKLSAVVYAAGVRTLIQDLSTSGNSKQPLDANNHRYIIYYRTDRIYFYIDTIDTPVATSNFQAPNVQTLPVRLLALANTSAPLSSGSITCTGLAVWDTGKNNFVLSDGTYGWRKVSISATGALSINPPTITKGTQSANGVTTQDLKDAGRNAVTYYMLIPVLATATDTLQSLTGTKGGATVTATTTPAVVTAGKTFRVTRMSATYIATATSGYGIVRLRYNTAGVVAITSPIAAQIAVGSATPATANATGQVESILEEGWEFPAATGIGISVQGFAAATATAVGYVLASVTGYEY